MGYGAEDETDHQLDPLVCALAGATEKLTLTLHWLAQMRVKSEVIQVKFLEGLPKSTPELKPQI